MVTKEVVATGDTLPPIGPYSQAVRAGDLLFVSGQPGIDPATKAPAGPTFGEQIDQVFQNLEAALRAGGSALDLVVSTTVLVADVSSFEELNRRFAEVFPADPPTRMTMQVPLPMGLLVSIGCVAIVRQT
jgi:2-iminobutanoate/2-iminopropanoate deaminase